MSKITIAIHHEPSPNLKGDGNGSVIPSGPYRGLTVDGTPRRESQHSLTADRPLSVARDEANVRTVAPTPHLGRHFEPESSCGLDGGLLDFGLWPVSDVWLSIAQRILVGEFHTAERSTRDSLIIGLRSIRHPVCQAALARIKPPKRARL